MRKRVIRIFCFFFILPSFFLSLFWHIKMIYYFLSLRRHLKSRLTTTQKVYYGNYFYSVLNRYVLKMIRNSFYLLLKSQQKFHSLHVLEFALALSRLVESCPGVKSHESGESVVLKRRHWVACGGSPGTPWSDMKQRDSYKLKGA